MARQRAHVRKVDLREGENAGSVPQLAAHAIRPTAFDKNLRPRSTRKQRVESAWPLERQSILRLLRAHFLIPKSWPFLSAVVAAVSLACLCYMGAIPPGPASIALGGAFAILSGSRFLSAIERRKEHGPLVQNAILLGGVVAPLALTGFGFALWSEFGGLPWPPAIASLAVISSVSAILLRRRLKAMLCALFACWSTAVIAHMSMEGLVALMGAWLIFVLIYRQQLLSDEKVSHEIMQAERVRDRAEQILRDYEYTGQGWFWETDYLGQITYISAPVAETIGFTAAELTARPFLDLFDLAGAGDGERTLSFHFSTRSAFSDVDVRAASQKGERWWSISGTPLYDGYGNFAGFRGSGTDLTEKKKSDETASRLAMFDSLTGLANRRTMADVLEKILKMPSVQECSCAVLLLDLDRFKQVNDTLGHPAGDALLRQVAERLQASVGPQGRVGRLGGDEFEVVIHGAPTREDMGELADDIIRSLSQPYMIDGHRVTIGASVGIALAPSDGRISEELIRNADLALYAAKDGGRGRHHFYSDDLHAKAQERHQLEADLRDAIANGSLFLTYQPVVDTATEKIVGFEALLRWTHPVMGPLSPEKFVPIAEDAGLIPAIGEWAIRTACSDLANWPEEVRVAVNVSPLQFASAQLPSTIVHALAHSGVAASRLELEITESVFLNDDEGTEAVFAALKAIGVRLVLDDFGTGYSSLGYLKKAPFDKIKIDQSFVRGATDPDSRNGAIIASITSLAHALGMDTTAEGVETPDELDMIRMYGCSQVQGYIYDKPMTAEMASERLRSGLAIEAVEQRSSVGRRHNFLHKVLVDHKGQSYAAVIKNISRTGAMIEGLWNVPAHTPFVLRLPDGREISCESRWSSDDRMGVEFDVPMEQAVPNGALNVEKRPSSEGEDAHPRKAG